MPQKIEPDASKTQLKRGSKPERKKLFPKDFPRHVSEKELHMHAWQWVQKCYPDLLIFHVPNGESRDMATAIKLKRMGVVPGVADFLMFVFNHAVAIELKEKAGHQSEAQKAFQKRWEACGNSYEIVHSLDEFIDTVWSYNQNP